MPLTAYRGRPSFATPPFVQDPTRAKNTDARCNPGRSGTESYPVIVRFSPGLRLLALIPGPAREGGTAKRKNYQYANHTKNLYGQIKQIDPTTTP
jgi:hypothetical protein